MEQNISFSISGIIEDIIGVLYDNLDLIAVFELLIIIALVIQYLRRVASLKDDNSFLEERLDNEHKERIKEQQAYYIQKKALENKLTTIKGTNNDNLGNSAPQKHPLPNDQTDRGTDKNEDYNFDQLENDPAPLNSSKNDSETKVPREYRYLEPAIDGRFFKSKVSEEKASFRTWLEGDVWKFEFCGNFVNALANINAAFDDSCIIEGKQNGATEIINIEPGILSDDLTIKTKAKIRLQ